MINLPSRKKILVLVQDYPDGDGHLPLMYVHTRNVYYSNNGFDVTVLNFSTKKNYSFEGIPVITLSSFRKNKEKFISDILVLHAANIRNHFVFLLKFGYLFKHFLFFFHGHEVLKINKVYSKPYFFNTPPKFKRLMQDIYDEFKLAIWQRYIPQIAHKSHFVFVSEWMKEEFFKWTKIQRNILDGISTVTYNCVSPEFENGSYSDNYPKCYDFITIRGNLDGSKYCIDIVNKLANKTPNSKFLVIGKGKFFDYYKKASNIEWLDLTLNHSEIIQYLDKAKYALMPTRTDAQGLMMCEMAAYGIPLITSDIPVCHEIFDGNTNVFFLNNDTNIGLQNFLESNRFCIKDSSYYKDKTIKKELIYLLDIINSEK